MGSLLCCGQGRDRDGHCQPGDDTSFHWAVLPTPGVAAGAGPAPGRGAAGGTYWYLQDKLQDIGILLQGRLQAGEQLPVLPELFLAGLSENLPASLWGTSGRCTNGTVQDEGARTPRPQAARGSTLQAHKGSHLLAALAQLGLGAPRAAGGLHPSAHHSQIPVGQSRGPAAPPR